MLNHKRVSWDFHGIQSWEYVSSKKQWKIMGFLMGMNLGNEWNTHTYIIYGAIRWDYNNKTNNGISQDFTGKNVDL
jgi:hypothetical protein